MELLRTNPAYYVAHSFYLLFCGFAAAWMLRAPLPALLTIMPLASIPAMIEYSWQAFERWSTGGPKFLYMQISICSKPLGVLGICGLGMLGLIGLCATSMKLSPAIHRSATSWHRLAHRHAIHHARIGRVVSVRHSGEKRGPCFARVHCSGVSIARTVASFEAAQVSAACYVSVSSYVVQNDLCQRLSCMQHR